MTTSRSPLFHSLNPLRVYWSRQARVFQCLTSPLFYFQWCLHPVKKEQPWDKYQWVMWPRHQPMGSILSRQSSAWRTVTLPAWTLELVKQTPVNPFYTEILIQILLWFLVLTYSWLNYVNAMLSANGSRTFIWKLCCHWLKGLQQHYNNLVRLFPVDRQ